jgi:hypothetical protein
MSERLARALPWIAAAGLLAAVLSVFLWSSDLRLARTDTGHTRPVVRQSADALLAQHPASVADTAFRRAVEQLQSARHVGAVWLFAADGTLLFASGSTAASTPVGRTAAGLATAETVRVVEALQETLTADQETALLAASAIMREGEHNDVFRHMLRPVTGPDGSIVGYLGVNYPANPALGGSVSPAYLAGLLVLLTGLAAYWLSLPFWVLLDAGPRGERAWVWAAFVLVGNLVALMAYLLTRAPRPATRQG